MEKIIDSLKQLKINLPPACTHSNLQKLHAGFLEYKQLVSSLPENCQEIRMAHEHNFRFLEFKINAITQSSNSRKDSKYYFKEALNQLHLEIDNIVASIVNADSQNV